MEEIKYRVVGIRADGSRRTLVDNATQDIAEKIKSEVPPGIFTKVIIEPDTDEPTSGGKESVELFPDQPPHPAR